MSKVFESLDKSQSQGTRQDPRQMLGQLKADPVSFMRQLGYNVPDGIDLRNPGSIISALMQSGQVPGSRYQQVMSMMQGRR